MSDDRVVVVGMGYVGLPAALLLAQSGCTVTGIDTDARKVEELTSAVLQLGESELAHLVADPKVRRNLKVRATLTAEGGDIFLIAVPTPVDRRKKIADLSHLEDAVRSIVPVLRPGNLVIIESTIPPLTCREVIAPLLSGGGLVVGSDLDLAHCPERILPGDVFREITTNGRVIGGTTPQAAKRAARLYERFVKGTLVLTDDVTAEMVKLLENTYRDVNIALANEIAAVAETVGVDPLETIELANLHPRVNLLRPGIGVGGHCIPLDPWFIKQVDPSNSRLIFAARLINDEQPYRIAAKIRRALRKIAAPRVVIIGATYKPNVPDTRESPALQIAAMLRADGYDVTQHDPFVDGMQYSSLRAIAHNADCLAVLVEHDVVRREIADDQRAIQAAMRNPMILRFYAN